MPWIKAGDRLPPYGKWVLVVGRANNGSAYEGPACRSHTDQRGEHFEQIYNISDNSRFLAAIAFWYEIDEEAPQWHTANS